MLHGVSVGLRGGLCTCARVVTVAARHVWRPELWSLNRQGITERCGRVGQKSLGRGRQGG